jgi:ParB-like chromosome segregation protein Spo0J
MEIIERPVAALIPYARNARKHDDIQVSQIASSIREFGFNNPVLIDPDNTIIAGHGRVLAAHKLALVSVPCIVLGHLTATQRRAYVIADNRLTETGGGWNVDLLALELEDLRLDGFDIDLTGFDANALDSIMNEAAGVGEAGEAGAGESVAREIDPDGFQLAHKCPKCGFEYD